MKTLRSRSVNPHDLADLDAMLSAEEKAVRAVVRRVCDDVVEPYIADWYERGELANARELAREFGKVGLLGMHLEGYGCAGMRAVDLRAGLPGAGGLRFRDPLTGLSAGLLDDVRHLALGE